jgi:alpha-ribazole phosphatase
MPCTLTLVRHTTPAIAPGICYGRLDIGLAPGFRQEAEQALGWMARPDLILASPLARAARLAEYLAQAHQTELRIDARLVEMNFGAWEGRPWDRIARAQLDAWSADLMGFAPPGGEPASALLARAGALLRELHAMPHAHIAIVAHAGSLRALLAQLAGVPLETALRWELAYGAVIAVACEPR